MSGVRIPPPRPSPLVDATERSSLRVGALPVLMRLLMVAVAHQVEHRIVAPEVAGSRPVSHPIFYAGFREIWTVLDGDLGVLKSTGSACFSIHAEKTLKKAMRPGYSLSWPRVVGVPEFFSP